MNKNNQNQDHPNDLSKNFDDYSDTLEFTDEDKFRLRHTNQQPIDEDYFAKEIRNQEGTQTVDQLVQDDNDGYEGDTEDSVHSKLEKSGSINEFRYTPLQEREQNSSPKLTKKHKPKKILSDIFKPTYEEHYDLEQLDDLQSYNQYVQEEEDSHTNQDKQESIEVDQGPVINQETMDLEEETEDSENFLQRIKQMFFGIGDEVESDESDSVSESDIGVEAEYHESHDSKQLLASKPDMVSKVQETLNQSFNRIRQLYTGEVDYDLNDLSEESFEEEASHEFKVQEDKDSTKDTEVVIKTDDLLQKESENKESIDDHLQTDETDSTDVPEDTIEDSSLELSSSDQDASIVQEDRIEDSSLELSSSDQDASIVQEDRIEDSSLELSSSDQDASIVQEDREETLSERQEEQDVTDISTEDIDHIPAEKNDDDEPIEIDLDSQLGAEQEDQNKDSILENIDKTREYTEEELALISDRISEETQEFQEPLLADYEIKSAMDTSRFISQTFDESQTDDTDKGKTSILGGTTWLTMGSIISRIIGALYVIPWESMFGPLYPDVSALYTIGYKPYSLFLAIATAGFPSSIAKQMSYYHSKKEYKIADSLFKNSLIIMAATGMISALILYLSAPTIAAISPASNDLEAATAVIRSLTPALLILPVMSLLRGYFQGFNSMKQTALSQIIEQITRVIYLLVATYAIIKIYQGQVNEAVIHSTFAAFIGALCSLLYLGFEYFRHRPIISKLLEQSHEQIELDLKESFYIMIKDSIPFILLGSGIIIAQLIDQVTFRQILTFSSNLLFNEIRQLYGTLSLDVDKLVMIVISIAVALASSLVPTITSYYARRNIKGTSDLVEHIILIFAIVMFPAAIGMAAVADNLYYFFFMNGLEIGPSLLVTAALSSIVLGLYTVLSTILQSMNFRRIAVRFLVTGIIVKILLQFPLVSLFQAHGALLSSMLAFGVTSILMWIKLNRELELNHGKMGQELLKIGLATLLMAMSAIMWNRLFNLIFGFGGRGLLFGKLFLVIVLSGFVYVVCLGLMNMLHILFGERFKEIQDKLRIL